MISMLDFNGDGQVSLDEFCLMVKDPDPARDEFGRDNATSQNAAADGPQRARELERRNRKRDVLSSFVSVQRIRKEDILLAWDGIRLRHERDRRVAWTEDGPVNRSGYTPSWVMNFEEFCDALPVDVTGQTRQVFGLLDGNGSGKIDAREMLISLCNFLSEAMTVDERCRLIFDLFDEDRSGFLSLVEVEGMMIGTHMQSREAIARKARTVMKVADSDHSGGITIKELVVAAAKFPNLLLPNHNSSAETGGVNPAK